MGWRHRAPGQANTPTLSLNVNLTSCLNRMANTKYLTAPIQTTQMPPGIPYIVANEAAERFSYYGMRSILLVFMTQYLLGPGGVLAPMGDTEATSKYHLFLSLVYLFPLLVAPISDIWLGNYRTILVLSFWMGRKKFVRIPPGGMGFVREALSGEGLAAMLKLGALYLFTAVFWCLYDQSSSVWVLQAKHMDLNVFGFEILPGQTHTINP